MTEVSPSRTASPGLVLFLGALAGLPALAIDMGLPALRDVSHSLNASAGEAGATLSLFILGFALAPLVLGPLADRFGRRPVLLGGLAVFTIAGFASVVAATIGQLLIARFAQGAGAGAAAIMPLMIIRDVFPGETGRRIQAHVSLVRGVSPAIAPVLGTLVLVVGSWREINLALAATGMLLAATATLGFRESRVGPPVRTAPAIVAQAYGEVLRNSRVMGPALLQALTFSTMFAYVAGAPLVLISVHGASAALFSLVFAVTSAAIMLGSFLSGRLARKGIPSRAILVPANACACAASLAGLVLAWTSHLPVAVLVCVVVVVNLAFGVVAPLAWHEAMQPMPRLAGYVSAVGSGLQMAAGSLASWLVASLFDGRSALSMTGVMALTSSLAMAVSLWMARARPMTAEASEGVGTTR